jgi:adenine-specific DNA-methyltransferase
MFYPIHIDPKKQRITGIGEPLPLGQDPDLSRAPTRSVAWPIRSDGSFGRWRIGPTSCRNLLDSGYLKLGGYDEKRKTWTVLYLQKKTISEIASGILDIAPRDDPTDVVELSYATDVNQLRPIKTVWNRSIHHAGSHGSTLLRNIFGKEGVKFSFPKSIYATRDAIAAIVRDRPNALIVDFFAGSGTTLNAINLLNSTDGGNRRCILVTNNEVSDSEAKALAAQRFRPGDEEWEQHGICRSVTWPRSKYTIRGKRDDGTKLDGEYLTGKTLAIEKPRRFWQVGFAGVEQLNTTAKKKQLVALIKDFPQSLVKEDSVFIVSEEHTVSILFDDSQAEAWVEALEEQDHITDFYIVTARKAKFDSLKVRITELLGPLTVMEDEKRPMREGFPANLEYFKLDFLDKNGVALGQQFREILPLLWLRAGAIGPRPELPKNKPIPAMLLPERNSFAILVDEARFADFLEALETRHHLTYVFLVTDSEEAFQEMAAQIAVPNVIQLYRDYLENFVINKGDGA